ncbi:S8 family serine peptidase [Actinokineospora auranticolor]|uniref:Subtilisin family serine protease n=1 Tax=Actinokineospora auranticolor TaxID=155976 RepID=A0A2S6GRH5_9PSEU|nr:S8 family serine peptidase [Actinokineospora auranticolor]PPK67848.1 subtilisin family serine protease [Actinokineospora auranticolor]
MTIWSTSRLRRAVTAAAAGVSLVVGMAGVAEASPGLPAAPKASTATGVRSYLVITAPNDTAGAKTAVATNGGTVFSSYDAIGVVVAHSSASDFATKMRAVSGVQQVGATRTTDVPAEASNPSIPAAPTQTTPTEAETNRPDMTQIKADQAWSVTTGSPSVLVGVLDTGVDDQHYDLKPNFDATKSASCAYGKLDTRPGSWRAEGDHGTHVAGTIAAAKNGKGAIGVAPSVHIASVRIAEVPSGLFFAENTICAFVFAADQGFKITNNSYYSDPWLFACPNNADQAATLEGVKRATAYAEGKGVLNVVAAGNENYDLANKVTDTTSPNDSSPASRPVNNSCLLMPGELPGVVTVSSINSQNVKSSFSNFGTGKITVTAPGDSVYSTLPGGRYGNLSGTSMATPHVAGVAALMLSANPDLSVADLRTRLAAQADDLPCADARCTGTTAKNNFYGDGRVDAKDAVTPDAAKTFENTADVPIPDGGAAVDSPITVTGVPGNAPGALKVDVRVVHTYRGDLVIDLVAPDGGTFRLKASSSSDSADNVIATYTVNAATKVANGTWRLRVRDVYRSDSGYIDSWKLTF